MKDADKSWLQWYWLELQDWIRLNGNALVESSAWVIVLILIITAICSLFR